jgi:hypothetical protein
MPGYIKKVLQKYKHRVPSKPQHCPYSPSPNQYGTKAQEPHPVKISPKLSPEESKEMQSVIGSILYYACAVNITVLMALSSIAIKQTKGTTSTMERPNNSLIIWQQKPDATTWFRVSDMIINVHLDALYLSAERPTAEHAGIFSWDGPPKTATQSNSMMHFLPYTSSSVSLSCPQLNPNLELSSSIAKRL